MKLWKDAVVSALEKDPVIKEELRPILVKGRIKDEESLTDKLRRKHEPEFREITPENLFNEIEDAVGVRLVVAQKAHVSRAVTRIRQLAKQGAWKIVDEVHYAWHPEEIREVEREGQKAETKPSAYCSRHFIIIRSDVDVDAEHLVKCELQVRTILEEAIFENDHRIRYNRRHSEVAAKVLARLAELLETADRLLADVYGIAASERDRAE